MNLRTPLLCLLFGLSAQAENPQERPAPAPFENGAAPVRQDDDHENFPPLVQITVDFIEVPIAEANRLLYKEKLGKDGKHLRAELQKMLDAGNANLLEVMACTTRSGHRAESSSNLEMMYPTEHAAPTGLSLMSDSPKEESEKPKPIEVLSGHTHPSSIETRNVGSALQIEPTLSADSNIIDLVMMAECVFHAGSTIHQSFKDIRNNESKVETPLFYSMKSSTSILLMDGTTVMLSLVSPKRADGSVDLTRKVFVLVRGDVVVAKP